MATLNSKLTRIKAAVTAIRNTIELPNAIIEDVAEGVKTKIEELENQSNMNLTSADYLFYDGARTTSMNELVKHISPECKTFISTFEGARIQEAPIMNTSSATTIKNMLKDNPDLVTIPLYDFQNVTNAAYFLYGATNLLNVPDFNMSKVTDFSCALAGLLKVKTLPLWDTSSGVNFNNFLDNAYELLEVPAYNTSKGKKFCYAFAKLYLITEMPQIDTSSAEDISFMLWNDRALVTIPTFNCDKVNKVSEIVSGCKELVNIGGFTNLGKAYTRTYANTSNYTLDLSDCTKLTHDSLMNVFNGLYDLNISYNVANGGKLYTQKIIISPESRALLTDDEVAIATNKGWTVVEG